ncbi:MAG: peptidylprolyl isomerase [Sterolibacteriaceae bacterium MAG5]|nr:peptidylprolyl isomerase [Candidatus Nitricoxidireducens bremensis]
MKRSLLKASVAAFAIALSAAPAMAKDKKPGADKGVAVVNGKTIPANRAEVLLTGQMAQGQPDSEELRNAVREELIRREILVQEAVRKGLDKKSEVVAQLDLTRQGVLIGAYLNDFVRTHPVSDEAIKKEYENIRAALGDKEYRARHVLVEKEDEAKAIVEKLKKGEKFEELAKQSKDPGSKERGGDLGWATPGSYVKPFAEAMAKLEKGKYTEAPVKSDFGWHVIQLDDVRDLKAPPLDEVKPQISQRMQQQMIEKHVMELRAKAKIE